MIDEKALEAATDALRAAPKDCSYRDCTRMVIEAYEAAKAKQSWQCPACLAWFQEWKPEEISDDGPEPPNPMDRIT